VITTIVPPEDLSAEDPGKQRDFTLLWSGSAASQLGSMTSATANPLLALTLTHSPVFAGWVAAASTVPVLLVHLPAGWVVDRFNRRSLMLGSQLCRLSVCGTLVGGLLLFPSPTPLLVVAALFGGISSVFYGLAEMTAVQGVVPRHFLSRALAKNEARGHIAQLTGRPLGGFLFSLGRALPYLADLLASIWSVAALLMMEKRDFQPQAKGAGPPMTQLRKGARGIVRDPFLRTVICVCTVGNLCFQILVLLLVVKAERGHMSSILVGLLLATSGVAGLFGAIGAPRLLRREGPHRILIACVWAWLPLTAIVAITAQPVVGLLCWGGLSFMGGHLNVALATYQSEYVPSHMLGRVMSITRLLTGGVVPLGALSGGYVIDALGPDGAAWLVVGAIALVTVLAPVLLRQGLRVPGRFKARFRDRAWMPPEFTPPEVHKSILVAKSVFGSMLATVRLRHAETGG
jgi:MFS family permease